MKKTKFEELPADTSVKEVFRYLFNHPLEIILERWNWKAAVLSGVMRGSIYFFTHIALGWRAAVSAMSVEFAFRFFNSGISASIAQLFRQSKPIWLATLCVMVLLPAYGHLMEFALHTLSGDRNKNKSIVFSVAFSLLSAVFNLFAMRRGALLVKDAEQKSFGRDLLKMPVIAAEFVSYPFVWLWRKRREKRRLELRKIVETES